jgi:hypothetical protein
VVLTALTRFNGSIVGTAWMRRWQFARVTTSLHRPSLAAASLVSDVSPEPNGHSRLGADTRHDTTKDTGHDWWWVTGTVSRNVPRRDHLPLSHPCGELGAKRAIWTPRIRKSDWCDGKRGIHRRVAGGPRRNVIRVCSNLEVSRTGSSAPTDRRSIRPFGPP